MVAAISPADINYEETLSTLRHGAFIISSIISCLSSDGSYLHVYEYL